MTGGRARVICAALPLIAACASAASIAHAAVPSAGGGAGALAPGSFAGYVWAGNVSSVQASWLVPEVVEAPDCGAAATWIGAEAAAEPGPFIQVGTSEECVRRATALSPALVDYYAFWSDTTQGDSPRPLYEVRPGDAVTANLTRARGAWTLTIADATSGARAGFTTVQEGSGRFENAQWLQEDVTDARTRRPFPYPRLREVRMSGLAVNGRPPSYAKLYSSWMSLGASYLGPTPLADDAFAIEPMELRPAAASYLAILRSTQAQWELFEASIARWTPRTSLALIRSSCAAMAGAIATEIRYLANGEWPPAAGRDIRTLILDLRSVRTRTRPPPRSAGVDLRRWVSRWLAAAARLTAESEIVKRQLDAPQL